MMREETEYFGHVETSYRRCGVCDYPYRYVGKSFSKVMYGRIFIYLSTKIVS